DRAENDEGGAWWCRFHMLPTTSLGLRFHEPVDACAPPCPSSSTSTSTGHAASLSSGQFGRSFFDACHPKLVPVAVARRPVDRLAGRQAEERHPDRRQDRDLPLFDV